MRGKLISFEGGEGSGKSTQVELLFKAFEKASIKAIRTREPGGSEAGEEIRKILVNNSKHNLEPITELLLNFAARKEHIEKVIKPALEKGIFVISDRFADSSLAYQGFGHSLGKELVGNIQNLSIGNFKPDCTIFLDMDVKKGLKRAKARSDKNRYEAMDSLFHERVREGFLYLSESEPERFISINAEKSIEQLHKTIISMVNARFGLNLKV